MSFSVNANLTLRQFYGTSYRQYATKSNRNDVPDNVLSFADAGALRKAVRSLMQESYNDTEDVTDTTGPVKEFAKKMKGFVDAYNYTYDSAKKSSSNEVRRAAKNMKKLVAQYADELDDAGITVKDDGYLNLRDSSTIKTTARFESLFGNDSKFMKSMDSIAKSVRSHVDVQV